MCAKDAAETDKYGRLLADGSSCVCSDNIQKWCTCKSGRMAILRENMLLELRKGVKAVAPNPYP